MPVSTCATAERADDGSLLPATNAAHRALRPAAVWTRCRESSAPLAFRRPRYEDDRCRMEYGPPGSRRGVEVPARPLEARRGPASGDVAAAGGLPARTRPSWPRLRTARVGVGRLCPRGNGPGT